MTRGRFLTYEAWLEDHSETSAQWWLTNTKSTSVNANILNFDLCSVGHACSSTMKMHRSRYSTMLTFFQNTEVHLLWTQFTATTFSQGSMVESGCANRSIVRSNHHGFFHVEELKIKGNHISTRGMKETRTRVCGWALGREPRSPCGIFSGCIRLLPTASYCTCARGDEGCFTGRKTFSEPCWTDPPTVALSSTSTMRKE